MEQAVARHDQIIREAVVGHGGEVFKAAGDAFYAAFARPADAVNAAVAAQRALGSENWADVDGLKVRMAVHFGSAEQRGSDFFGPAPNRTARLLDLAHGGQVLATASTAELLVAEREVQATLEKVGTNALDDPAQPVGVFQVVAPGLVHGFPPLREPKKSRTPVAAADTGAAAKAKPASSRSILAAVGLGMTIIAVGLVMMFAKERKPVSPAVGEPGNKSVAVLAFTNLSEDKNNEYFSDGVSEELLNVLAKIPGLKVSARTSAFYFKGKQVPIAEIAKQLGVAYVVEGSVRKSGDRLRITAQLINAADGFHVWSDNFDRDAKDVFAVQDEIAGLIAHNLQLKIAGGISDARAVNPQVLEYYLRGRQAWNLRTKEGFAQAEDLFHRALELEPGFARAYTGLADVRMIRESDGGDLGFFGNRDSPALAKIVAQIERALALDPNSAEAYASLGTARWFNWKFAEAETALRRAIALNPNYATAHHWLGRVLLSDGRIEESIRELARAAELDPLSSRILDNYSLMLRVQGKYEEALVLVDRALALQPDAEQAGHWRVMYLSELGRHAEAMAQLRRMPVGSRFYVPWTVKVLVGAGLRPEAEQAMKELTPQAAHFRYVGLAALGRPDEALAALSADFVLVALVSDLYLNPDLDSLRNDPRFVQLLATLGRTEANSHAQAWRVAHPSAPRK